MNNCPSKFDLAHWAAQQANAEKPLADALSQHVADCDRCHAYIEELSEARQMLLGADPARASLQAARSILAAAEQRRHSWWRWKLMWPVAALPAAVLVDAGQIFPYYDEASLHSVATVAGNQVALPGSVELDDHKGVERIFALWSTTPLAGESGSVRSRDVAREESHSKRWLRNLSSEEGYLSGEPFPT